MFFPGVKTPNTRKYKPALKLQFWPTRDFPFSRFQKHNILFSRTPRPRIFELDRH